MIIMDNTSITLLEFAWHSLTEQQQTRINLKYDLVNELKALPEGECKRDVYRVVADRYCYTMIQVEWIANHKLKEK
jgi:hypothetical protein